MDGLKKADVQVVGDFTSSDIKFDCKLTLRVSLGNILGAVLKAGWAFPVGFIRLKPDPDHPKNSVFPALPELPDLPDLPDLPGIFGNPEKKREGGNDTANADTAHAETTAQPDAVGGAAGA